jgi:hypothetical protein
MGSAVGSAGKISEAGRINLTVISHTKRPTSRDSRSKRMVDFRSLVRCIFKLLSVPKNNRIEMSYYLIRSAIIKEKHRVDIIRPS